MFVINGKHAHAKIMTDQGLDETTMSQLYNLINHPMSKGTKIAIMPDVHAGKGCVIGYTQTLSKWVCPNLIGVDIGCGVEAFKLGLIDVDFPAFHKFLVKRIPTGSHTHPRVVDFSKYRVSGDKRLLKQVERVVQRINSDPKLKITQEYAENSLGSLGGGNHFIELDKDSEGNIWLILHSGSRNFGYKTAAYHQNRAKELMVSTFQGAAYKGLEFLPLDQGGQQYLDDMLTAQFYAEINRTTMINIILQDFFKQEALEAIKSVHNYISFEDKIVRKGAIQAHLHQDVVIPLNMKDGVILGKGKGDPDWNMSAPHGAGRVMSRSQAKRELDADEFVKEMEEAGVYSECVGKKTLDEAPAAYKDAGEIIDAIGDSVHIIEHMKPVFAFKDTTS